MARADSEEIRAFAASLRTLSDRLDELTEKTSVGLNSLGEVWDDDQFEEFRSSFSVCAEPIGSFTAEGRGYAVGLEQKAALIEGVDAHVVSGSGGSSEVLPSLFGGIVGAMREHFSGASPAGSEESLQGVLPGVQVNEDGLSAGAIHAVKSMIQDFCAAGFGGALGRLAWIGTYRGGQPHWYAWDPNEIAHASTDGARLGLNPAFFSGSAKENDAVLAKGEVPKHKPGMGGLSCFHPPGTGNMRGVVLHELGHHLKFTLESNERGRAFVASWKAGVVSLAKPNGSSKEWVMRDLSRYSAESVDELWAEAFASAWLTPASQRGEIASYTRSVFEALGVKFPAI